MWSLTRPIDSKKSYEPASLKQMKEDALADLQQRLQSLVALEYITSADKPSGQEEADSALQKSIKVLTNVIKDIEGGITKLDLFGYGFQTDKITGVDAQAIVALASWGSGIDRPSSIDEVAPKTAVQETEPEGDDLFGDKEIPSTNASQQPQATESPGPILNHQL